MFWSLWDQSSGGSWTLQAQKMDLHWFGMDLIASQVQTANPILILLFIPLVNYVLYPFIDRFFTLTPLRKIGIGLFLTAASYLVIWYIQQMIDAGGKPSVNWQFLAYVILTLGEAMVSITGLEFSYTQAPNKMKSAVMALWLFTVSMGNLFTAGVNFFIRNADGTVKMNDQQYFLFFAALMLAASVVFVIVASFYRGRTYLQSQEVALEDRAVEPGLRWWARVDLTQALPDLLVREPTGAALHVVIRMTRIAGCGNRRGDYRVRDNPLQEELQNKYLWPVILRRSEGGRRGLGAALSAPRRPICCRRRLHFLAAIVWLAFGQTVRHGFLNYDDDMYVYQNLAVTAGLTRRGILWAFTFAEIGHWHPVTWFSHAGLPPLGPPGWRTSSHQCASSRHRRDPSLSDLAANDGRALAERLVWRRSLRSIRSGWNRWPGSRSARMF